MGGQWALGYHKLEIKDCYQHSLLTPLSGKETVPVKEVKVRKSLQITPSNSGYLTPDVLN